MARDYLWEGFGSQDGIKNGEGYSTRCLIVCGWFIIWKRGAPDLCLGFSTALFHD